MEVAQYSAEALQPDAVESVEVGAVVVVLLEMVLVRRAERAVAGGEYVAFCAVLSKYGRRHEKWVLLDSRQIKLGRLGKRPVQGRGHHLRQGPRALHIIRLRRLSQTLWDQKPYRRQSDDESDKKCTREENG